MKQSTRSEYEKAVNRVIDHINKHLYNTPGIKELSEIANMSEYHFHRVFKMIIGENIGEYINRIRLEHIAQNLSMTNLGIQEIAERTGYGTKHALSKAFKKHFGIAPSVYRRQPQNTTLFFKKERETLDIIPEIKHVDEKKIVYIRIIDWYGSPESYKKAWRELGKFAKQNQLIKPDTEFIGLSFDDPTITPPEKCRFYACFTVKDGIKPTGPFGIQSIPSGQYAVFLHHGSYRKLIDTYYYIYVIWLPHSGYRLCSSMSFEKYVNNLSQVKENELITEVYVPVKHKRI